MYNAVVVFCYTAAIQKTAVITFRVSFFFGRSQIFFFFFFHHLQTSKPLHSAPLHYGFAFVPLRSGFGGLEMVEKRKEKNLWSPKKKRNSESDHGSFLDSSGVTKNKTALSI